MDISHVLQTEGIVSSGFGEPIFYLMAEYSGSFLRHILRSAKR